MKLTEVPFDMVGYLALRFGHASRSPGLHMSTILHDIEKVLNAKRYASGITQPELEMFGSLGFLWERVLEDTLADITVTSDPARYFRPDEQKMDGVYLTPDYADLDFWGDGTCEFGLEEWKVIWKSSRSLDNFERNFWRFIVQSKSYCRALGCLLVRFRILCIVGNWQDNIAPVCRTFEIEYTPQELEENWSMLMNHAKAKGMVRP